MKNTQKIFLAIFMVAFALGRILAFDENAVITNDSSSYNALFGIDTSKDIITDTIQGRLGDNSGQSVCATLPKTEIYPEIDATSDDLQMIGDLFYGYDSYSAEQIENLFKIRIDYMEIKRKNNESVCVYVIAIDKSFWDTKLSSDEVERFEDFLLENELYLENALYDERKYYRAILKFFKHYGKMDTFYDDNALAFKVFKAFLRLEGEVERATESGKAYAPIAMYRFANGEVLDEPPYSKLRFGDKQLSEFRATWGDLPHKLTQKNVQNCRYPHLPNCKRYERELRTIIHFVADKLDYELWY